MPTASMILVKEVSIPLLVLVVQDGFKLLMMLACSGAWGCICEFHPVLRHHHFVFITRWVFIGLC